MSFYLSIEGETVGPYSPEEASNFLERGQIAEDCLACVEGSENWVPLRCLLAEEEEAPSPEASRPKLITGAIAPLSIVSQTTVAPTNLTTQGKTCPFCGAIRTRRAPEEFQPGGFQFYANRYCPICHAVWRRQISETIAQIEFTLIGIGSLLVAIGTAAAVIGILWAFSPPEGPITPELVEAKKSASEGGVRGLILFVPLLIGSIAAFVISLRRLLNKGNRRGEVLSLPSKLRSGGQSGTGITLY